ncbi:MAG: iron-containing alcohol dehydrogenase [Eubacteriales bacterium]
MEMNFNMPVKIISGEGCVTNSAEALCIGSRALIVTGRSSAVKSGALADVTAVLEKNGVDYTVFDKISENPLMSVCFEGGAAASALGADFIIGIGGGSPLDASKSIAAYAANPDIAPQEIFTAALAPSLPIIAVPTTAGTGSEVNRYSVLTLDESNKKKTFSSDMSYPRAAFLDPRYTCSLSAGYTMSTALDAFCHALESYLSPKATVLSSLAAEYAARSIWNIIRGGHENSYTFLERRELMFAACAAGIAINTTGTGFPHPLGYNLTLSEHKIPHGRACGAFTGEYIAYNMRTDDGKCRLEAFSASLGCEISDIAREIPALAGVKLTLDADTIARYVKNTASAGNYKNSPYVINENEQAEIYRRLFGEK